MLLDDLTWVSDGCQMGVRWMPDGCQMDLTRGPAQPLPLPAEANVAPPACDLDQGFDELHVGHALALFEGRPPSLTATTSTRAARSLEEDDVYLLARDPAAEELRFGEEPI